MSNEYYDHTTFPATGSPRSSALMRSELDAVEDGFDKLPTLASNGLKPVAVNAGGTALEAVAFATFVNNLLTSMTADASPDVTADYVATADASGGTGKKVLIKNLFAAASAVGIGTASPSYQLDVYKATGQVDIFARSAGSGGSDIGNIVAAGGSNYLQISAYGTGTTYVSSVASAALVIENLANAPILFRVNAGSERGRIDTNGYLLWGYTSSNGAYPLQVNGQIFATNATIATSDARYKQAVQSLTGALNLVSALRPVTFRWKRHPVHKFDSGEQVGFIAQEVETAFGQSQTKGAVVKQSRAVVRPGGKDKDGNAMASGLDEEFLGLAESKLIPYLVGAVQELKAIVDAQARRIATLEGGR